jgi:hypothetical protein
VERRFTCLQAELQLRTFRAQAKVAVELRKVVEVELGTLGDHGIIEFR